MEVKILFFNLQIEDVKRRLWIIVLTFLAFFFTLPITYSMQIESIKNLYLENGDKQIFLENGIKFLGSGNSFLIFFTIVIAIIAALSSFCFLHSKKKTDFYHSLPVKREQFFFIYYIDGILIYIIPYSICLAFSLIIGIINKAVITGLLTNVLLSLGINILFYILIYTITIIAVLLTGNIIISILGTGVFLFYIPFIEILKSLLYTTYFDTYYAPPYYRTLFFLTGSVQSFSPIFSYIKTIGNFYKEYSFPIHTLLFILVQISLFTSLALVLYKKRPSETAGKAIVYNITKPIIKVLLVIPISLFGALLFQNLSDYNAINWSFFGIICVLLLSNCAIEIIYNFDFRSAFFHKKQLIFSAIVTLFLFSSFVFDLFGYDTYIPKKDKVESVSVAFSHLNDGPVYDIETNSYLSSQNYSSIYMELADINAAYELAQIGINPKNLDFSDENNWFTNYTIQYNLKNGKKVLRSYKLLGNNVIPFINEVYKQPTYKQGSTPLYQIQEYSDISSIICSKDIQTLDLTLSNKEKEELINLYLSEFNHLTYYDLMQKSPIATLSFIIATDQKNEDGRIREYIYPNFTKTIAFLQKHGFDVETITNPNQIKEIKLEYKSYISENNIEGEESQQENIIFHIYKKPEEIEEIYPNLVHTSYDRYYVKNDSKDIRATVIFKTDEYGNEAEESYHFTSDSIPEFVKRDLNYKQD